MKVLLVDDEELQLLRLENSVKDVLKDVELFVFNNPEKALEEAKKTRIDLAFLDIELGLTNGIDLCNELLEINPRMNIIFLTAYPEYSIKAWNTKASGFMVKPITLEGVKEQLKKLRHPFPTGGII